MATYARRSSRRCLRDLRESKRGVTLFEVLIVVAIIAMVAAGVAIAAHRQRIGSTKRTTATNARVIRSAVGIWQVDHDSRLCPTLQDLQRDGVLDPDSPAADAWGTPWQIECSGLDVSVTSPGSDRQAGTGDDIRVPEGAGR